MTEMSETSGETRETSEDIQSHGTSDVVDPVTQVKMLDQYLRMNFPEEVNKVIGPNGVELPVETAIRLLTHLSAREHPALAVRCTQPFCNKPQNHQDECGWVNV